MTSQKEALENLISQRTEIEKKIVELQNTLEQGRAQYLKVTGAIDVLEQLVAEETTTEEVETTTEEVETEE